MKRVTVRDQIPEIYGKILEAGPELQKVLGDTLSELVKLRVSYLNGCAFCVDKHTQDALSQGESQQRLFLLAVWHEAPAHFTDAERAALELVDQITRLGEHGVSDEAYAAVAEHYSERETAALILAAAHMNLLNRVGVTTHLHPPVRRSS
ncbi:MULTISPECIES: carboxymuconolactone decarboxylase family protein [Nocardiopsis]|uniref:carboxymuconolactone decarboxylase family protein n=1 Tax=Nocardiopsis TaxID=2013 RepID=UPI00034805C8|nr:MULTISPECIES: carboxymuconolactone decarboxylase family protein [Nocardiopsis]